MPAVLVVDLNRVLDESALGKGGAAALAARYATLKEQHDKLQQKGASEKGKAAAAAAAAEFERGAQQELERERARLREDVLARTRPIVAALLTEKKAEVVVDAAAVLASVAGVDVTDVVVARLDAAR